MFSSVIVTIVNTLVIPKINQNRMFLKTLLPNHSHTGIEEENAPDTFREVLHPHGQDLTRLDNVLGQGAPALKRA